MMNRLRAAGLAAAASVTFVALTPAAEAQSERIVNIFNGPAVGAGSAQLERFNGCARPPVAITNLQSIDVYSDKATRTISGDRWVQQVTAMRGLRDFSAFVVREADAALLAPAGGQERAACAARWLENWARGRALLGSIEPSARYDTLWFGQVPLAVAYLKIKDNPGVTAAQRRVIEPWFSEIARAAIRVEAALVASNGEQAAYRGWTIAAAAAAAVATNDRALLDRAITQARAMLEEVTADGALPKEIQRGRRAFQHHVWAFEPLALTVLIAERNGVRLAQTNDFALRRVLRLIIANARGQTRIAELAGIAQDGGIWSWPRDFETGALEIYNAVERVPEVEEKLSGLRPARSPFTGGDWTRTLPVQSDRR